MHRAATTSAPPLASTRVLLVGVVGDGVSALGDAGARVEVAETAKIAIALLSRGAVVDVAVVHVSRVEPELAILGIALQRSPSIPTVVVAPVERDDLLALARDVGGHRIVDPAALDPRALVEHVAETRRAGVVPSAELHAALLTMLGAAMRSATGGPRAREARVLWSLGLSDKEASSALGITRASYREALVAAGVRGSIARGGVLLLREALERGAALDQLVPWLTDPTRRRIAEALGAEPRQV
jgi:hypothetical protein